MESANNAGNSKSNSNGLKIALIVIGGFVALIVAVIAICALSYVSASNQGNGYEQQIDERRQNSVSVLSNYTMKVKEMASVPDQAVGDLERLIKASMEGRYGDGGSKATVQFMREHNISIDQTLYRNLQSVMSGGRDEFKNSQDRLISQCRAYKTDLGNVWSGFWLKMAGYPKADLNVICRVVSDGKTDAAFQTGQQTPVSLK